MVAGCQQVYIIGAAVADQISDRSGIGDVDIVAGHSDDAIIPLPQKIAQMAPVLAATADDDRSAVAVLTSFIQASTTSSLGSGNTSRCPL